MSPGTYSGGVCVNNPTQNILWQGCVYAESPEDYPDQLVTLSSPISKTLNGIVLIFGYYNGTNVGGNLNHFFIPKQSISLYGNRSFSFVMANASWSLVAGKTLFITDTTISGDNQNGATGTQCGVNYNNNAYVLCCVLGV